ncbi:MAG TPA: HAMP domain-containing protein [bacterium (Candidatus Stahlbacteria)]|nr:HAMP domain-containing protein [Candidatus Stahlbacteria bacterium]
MNPLEDQKYLAQLRTMESGRVYDIAVPIKVVNKRIGVVHLGLSRAPIDRAVANTRSGLLIITGIILVFSLVAIFFILTIMTHSLTKITEEVVAIGNGDLERKIGIKQHDEIGQIARAVDEMAEKLKQAQRNLIEQERIKREMQIAKEIQLTLLPRETPEFSGFEIATLYRSAMEVGGDYYDFFKVDDNRFGIVVGDVSGKGVGGSLLMTMVRTILRFQVLETPDPIKLLSILNYLLEHEIPEDMFVTIFYCLFHMKENEVQFASAGHNPSVIQRDSDLIKLNPAGPPIGIIDGRGFAKSIQANSIFLNPRDLFVLYTDGVIDAKDKRGERFGEDRFYTILKKNPAITAPGFRDLLVESIDKFTEGLPQEDDITMVAIRRL